ncbi:MAG: hypothetical protein B7Y41_07875 [Hydrogenophilales bacterium 28-61-23]|nr:MAG: hypothetical protein B7Y41_07875 [Hydrogenophilales bacterium 28-61-23]
MKVDPRLAHTLLITASTSLIALIFLSVAWELWLAPLRPGGSWLVLKVLPLLALLFGILRGKMYTYRWSTLLIWLYFTEGAVRAWSDGGLSSQLATLEWILALIFFTSAAFFTRASARV